MYRAAFCVKNIEARCICVLYRSAMVQLLCSLYGLTVIIITFVFSVAAALTAGDATSAGNAIYLQVFLSFYTCHPVSVWYDEPYLLTVLILRHTRSIKRCIFSL